MTVLSVVLAKAKSKPPSPRIFLSVRLLGLHEDYKNTVSEVIRYTQYAYFRVNLVGRGCYTTWVV